MIYCCLRLCSVFVGLLQGSWQGVSSKAASDCKSQVLQPKSRKKDQRCGRGLCTGGVDSTKFNTGCSCFNAFTFLLCSYVV